MVPPETNNGNRARLDVWLDVACLFRTRSEAQRACRGGKVDVNNQRAKPHRMLQTGDRISISRPNKERQQVVVQKLETQHLPKSEAKALYDDVTPAPSQTELEHRLLYRHPGTPRRRDTPRVSGAHTDKRQRRARRHQKKH
ncbi:MAG: RNA-binding protein [Acidobacteria bacterium]|nr:RNA-binding protein [Acidobacteriota bacterium]